MSLSKLCFTLFIPFIHSTNVYGFGIGVPGFHEEWPIPNEYYSIHDAVLSYLPSDASFQLQRMSHCPTILEFDEQFSVDPCPSVSSPPQSRYKYSSLWRVFGLALEREWVWIGCVAWATEDEKWANWRDAVLVRKILRNCSQREVVRGLFLLY